MFLVVYPAMKTAEGEGCGGPCGRGGEGTEGGRKGREGDKGGRGEEGGSAQEESSNEGFRGSEGIWDCSGVDLQRVRSVVGWLLTFKLSSSLSAEFGCTQDKLIPLICTIYRTSGVFCPFLLRSHRKQFFRCPLVTSGRKWSGEFPHAPVMYAPVISCVLTLSRPYSSLQLHSNTYLVLCKAISALKNKLNAFDE